MWVTTINIDLGAFYALDASSRFSAFSAMQEKRAELRATDGGGDSHNGAGIPDPVNGVSAMVDAETTPSVIKRAWNTQAAADEFAAFVGAYDFNTVTVEEVA